ncbi:hemerythrin domain-containing protein [Yinghuangia seranimata]|uniref:hemerythrin domain-containing protein n=1 Tax=Yinghuangia seranimata TaxID=408067 RepID=UPI00248C83C0|nr:hemerythrin domain-containing protein [Yinghuangia seranimata]MDI2125403.1 hemerythrin domain-containing protein [Yinghuangia seranimata]
MSRRTDVTEELTADHRRVERLFAAIGEAPVRAKRRKELADTLTTELMRHSAAEEAYLYPTVRETVPGGDSLADKELADHAGIEGHLRDLEGYDADHERFDALLAVLKAEVAEHVRNEEERLFPRLRRCCSADRLGGLGDDVRRAKRLAGG